MSPMRAMELEAHGVRWRYPEVPVAHPASDGSVAYVAGSVEATGAALAAFDPADGGGVIFGPAGRALQQLPLEIGFDGELQAGGNFSGPVGPSFWGVRRG